MPLGIFKHLDIVKVIDLIALRNQQQFHFGLTGLGFSKLEPNQFLNKLRLTGLAKSVKPKPV